MQPLEHRSAQAPKRRSAIFVRGDRVLLRSPRAGDRDEWVKLRRANWRHLRAAEPTPEPRTDPCGDVAFRRLLDGAFTDRTLRLLVCTSLDQRIIGQITFGGISRGCFQSCFIGYWMGRAFTGQGLMIEALSLATKFAFAQLDLHRIEANIAPSNHVSRAVAKRCGFRYEGRARRLLHLAGRWRDHERWAIVRNR